MTMVNVHQAKTQLSQLLEQACAGEEVIIARAGKPVARLVPIEPEQAPRQPGLWKGRVWMAPDFDEWPPEIREAFGMDEP